MNKITHFIDGSSIYGSTPEQTGKLRNFEKGMLRIFNDFGRSMLPLSEDPDECLSKEQNSACYLSGIYVITRQILQYLFIFFCRRQQD